MRLFEILIAQHNPALVLLAAFVCLAGSWIAMTLLQQTQHKQGQMQWRWMLATAIGAGVTVWCTHFTAMMAFHPGEGALLDMPLTMASLCVAVVGCTIAICVGLKAPLRLAPEIGGGLAGLAIASMHYTGMAAYKLSSPVAWNLRIVAASVALAVLIGALAFNQIIRNKYRYSLPLGKISFALGIIVLHFTGMAAMTVLCSPETAHTGAATFSLMGIVIGAVGLLTIANSLATQLIETRGSRETIERFQHMALTDALTGLPNRVNFIEHLENLIELGSKIGRKIAVVGIDLDRFKEINDLRGHAAGDIALQIIGGRLAALHDETSFFARLGGDEFGAALTYRDDQHLLDLVGRIEATLFQPLVINDFETVTGASIGVAIFPDDGRDRERLMSNADLAMYRAKNALGQAVCFFEARMENLAHERHELSQDLRRAIERGQLQLHYQVQTSVASGEVIGYEALLRWHHPNRGLVAPEIFIPIAEETGDILAIGEWVLRTACQEAVQWATPYKVSVNISPVQFAHAELAQLILSILMESRLPPKRLELEITETTIITDKKRTLHMLRQIRALGVTVAIDDFGIGYSSLDTLRSFPFDKIKLDRSFMNEVGRDTQAKAIIRAVLALGKSLNIPVLAEGVETSEQLEILKTEGCDEAQGYLLGEPGLLGRHQGQPAGAAHLS